jgi:hypothetical protein
MTVLETAPEPLGSNTSLAFLRSEGPVISSPVREGEVDPDNQLMSVEGAPLCVGPSGLGLVERRRPALTDGAKLPGPSDLRAQTERLPASGTDAV